MVAVESTALILGETGSGKGVLARWLHNHGPRADEAFVDLNCAGLSRELLESELFGHAKGAFTGAAASKPGLLEIGHRGTVFLDEIGDTDPLVQAKLLTVLEEKRFRRVGDVHDRRVDVRLLAATHQDLVQLVRDKKFRSDLYFRVSTIPLVVPPLRERAQDIPVLAAAMLRNLCRDVGRAGVGLSPAAEKLLQAYAWPGNLRELRNVLERGVLLSRRDVLGPEDLRFDPAGLSETARGGDPHGDGPDVHLTLRDVERRHIERVLADEGGRVELAAARLGVPRSSLYEKIKRHGIGPAESSSKE